MSTEIKDPIFGSAWNGKSLSLAYEFFQIRDERSICTCGRITQRVFDGKCYACHYKLFRDLEREPCPPLPPTTKG